MRHALQVPLHDMYKTQNHKWELHLTFPEGHKLDLDHAMVSAGPIVQLCIAPCSVPNWVNDVSSMYSTSNGVKGVYCKYHGTTWTTLHQRKHSNSSPMDPNTEIQCEKMDQEKGESHLECLDRSQFEMVTHPWVHVCSWQHKLPVTTGPWNGLYFTILDNHKITNGSHGGSVSSGLRGVYCRYLGATWASGYHWNLKSQKHGESHRKRKSGYQLKMVDHSIWHSKTFRWGGSVQYSARATTWQFRFRESSVTDYRYKFHTLETGVGETQQWRPTTGAATNHERS